MYSSARSSSTITIRSLSFLLFFFFLFFRFVFAVCCLAWLLNGRQLETMTDRWLLSAKSQCSTAPSTHREATQEQKMKGRCSTTTLRESNRLEQKFSCCCVCTSCKVVGLFSSLFMYSILISFLQFGINVRRGTKSGTFDLAFKLRTRSSLVRHSFQSLRLLLFFLS